MSFTITFKHCQVVVDDENRYLVTRFEDGTYVPATPNYTDDDILRAYELGYDGDTWQLSLDHEVAHTFLATREGLQASPTLWKIAHPDFTLSAAAIANEEARVLEFQRLLVKPWWMTHTA